jgi:aryl-alcohol dehydrogenase-like predicted oxidoreductase
MGALGRRDSLNLLEAAWDAGIRHFDVAPMYGYGEAEGCLGEFLRRHSDQITFTTKFGISPEEGRAIARIGRTVLRPIVKQFPGLKQQLSRSGPPVLPVAFPPVEKTPPPKAPNPIFTAEEARRSLQRSLVALKADYIDVLLLHDVKADDLIDDSLLRLLEDFVQSGTIGTFGVGTDRNQIDPLLRCHPSCCQVLQYEWSILNPVPTYTNIFRIHHRSLTGNFRSLHASLLAEKNRCTRWSQSVGADLADIDVLANLMLKAALVLNPESVILFSSKNPAHIQANVELASDESLTSAAIALYRIVQAEMLLPPVSPNPKVVSR